MPHPVHLIGGPHCGTDVPNVPEDHHSLLYSTLTEDSVYTYCPHATATLSALRDEYTTVFIHTSIEHDAFDPSQRLIPHQKQETKKQHIP